MKVGGCVETSSTGLTRDNSSEKVFWLRGKDRPSLEMPLSSASPWSSAAAEEGEPAIGFTTKEKTRKIYDLPDHNFSEARTCGDTFTRSI